MRTKLRQTSPVIEKRDDINATLSKLAGRKINPKPYSYIFAGEAKSYSGGTNTLGTTASGAALSLIGLDRLSIFPFRGQHEAA